MSTKTDIRIQQKHSAQQPAKRKPHSAEDTYRKANKFKSVGTAARVQCKREASRIRRAIAFDRSANDIAKQVTMTRERHKSHQHTWTEVACRSDNDFQSEPEDRKRSEDR